MKEGSKEMKDERKRGKTGEEEKEQNGVKYRARKDRAQSVESFATHPSHFPSQVSPGACTAKCYMNFEKELSSKSYLKKVISNCFISPTGAS